MNIAVIGLGHVGLAYALLFASKYKVVAYDIDSVKINNLKKDILPSKNEELMKFFCENNLNITFFLYIF
ncbi:UDP-glucose 6-dehydrogenase [Streptococcus pneumoniae]|nr:UDP-glucose 6-dehydrogenase [Streptococcus pneumoniae]